MVPWIGLYFEIFLDLPGLGFVFYARYQFGKFVHEEALEPPLALLRGVYVLEIHLWLDASEPLVFQIELNYNVGQTQETVF